MGGDAKETEACGCVDDRQRRRPSDTSASSDVLDELIECQCRIGEVVVADLVPSPPDGGYGWVVVLCAFGCNFIFDGCCYGFGVMLPALQAKFGGSNAEIAFAGALCTAVMSIEGPLVSALVNALGVRRVATTGVVLSSVSLLASSYAPSLPWFWTSYSVGAGVGMGMVFMPVCIHVGTYFERRRALATGLSVAGSGAGTFVVAPALAYALERESDQARRGRRTDYGLELTLQLQAAVMLVAVVFTMAMIPLKPSVKALELKETIEEGELLLKEAIEEMGTTTDSGGRRQSRRTTKARSYKDLHRLKSKAVSHMDVLNLARHYSKKDDKPVSPSVLNGGVSRNASRRGWFLPNAPPDVATDRVDHDGTQTPPRAQSFARRRTSTVRRRHSRQKSVRVTAADYADGVHELRQVDDGVAAAESMAQLASIDPTDFARPMARQDVLLSQYSIKHLPAFAHGQSMAEYRENQVSVPCKCDGEMARRSRTTPFTYILSEMVDVSLLAHMGLLGICLAHVFAMLGLYTPFIFIGSRAVANGSPASEAAYLVSYIGIANTIGRIVAGGVADLRLVSALGLSSAALCVCGVANIALVFTDTYVPTVVYCVLFGFVIAAFLALTSIVLVEQVGIEKLTNAYGILAVFRGVALLFGSPLAGVVYDHTHDYNMCFVLSGLLFVTAGLVGMLVVACRRGGGRRRTDTEWTKVETDVDLRLRETQQRP